MTVAMDCDSGLDLSEIRIGQLTCKGVRNYLETDFENNVLHKRAGHPSERATFPRLYGSTLLVRL